MLGRKRPVVFAASWLLIAILVVLSHFAAHYFNLFPYPIYTHYPKITFAIGMLSLLLTVTGLYRLQDGGIQPATIILLLVSIPVAFFGWFVAGWTTYIHQSSVSDSDHVYHLAIDPLLDVGNPYLIFECGKLGIICREAFGGAYSHDHSRESAAQLTLILDEAASTLLVVTHDGQPIHTHPIP